MLWHAADEDSHIYTYRELYVRETLAADVAKQIVKLTGGEQIAYTVASPDMWQKRGLRDVSGECIADSFINNGVPLLKADNSRVIGWQRVREYMADAPDGAPYWQVFDCCKNLIRTLPELLYDSTNPEDVAPNSEDHAAESLRYALMSRPARTRAKAIVKPRPYDPLSDTTPQRGGFFAR